MQIKTVDEYMSELKNGNKIRIRYNERIEDCLGGYWSEELWQLGKKNDIYFCFYPISSYDSSFHTAHSEENVRRNIKNAIRDIVGNEDGEQTVISISIEQGENIKQEEVISEMREATSEENESISDYLDSVSKPTGFNVFDNNTIIDRLNDFVKYINNEICKGLADMPASIEDAIRKNSYCLALEHNRNAILNILAGKDFTGGTV